MAVENKVYVGDIVVLRINRPVVDLPVLRRITRESFALCRVSADRDGEAVVLVSSSGAVLRHGYHEFDRRDVFVPPAAGQSGWREAYRGLPKVDVRFNTIEDLMMYVHCFLAPQGDVGWP